MQRRNIVIVDDDETEGVKVVAEVEKYYTAKPHLYRSVIPFLGESCFAQAKNYIQSNRSEIDIIFSDQRLAGGQGTDLFRLCLTQTPTEYESIQQHSLVWRLMHSVDDTRLNEHQEDFIKLFHRFVNSSEPAQIKQRLNWYEDNIVQTKESGNPNFNHFLNVKRLRQKLSNKIKINGEDIPLKNVLFLLLDRTKDKSEYYHIYYMGEEKILFSSKSIKPDSKINEALRDLVFITGNLQYDNNLLCKVNPLWISLFNTLDCFVKVFTPFNIGFDITFNKVNSSSIAFADQMDDFFLKY